MATLLQSLSGSGRSSPSHIVKKSQTSPKHQNSVKKQQVTPEETVPGVGGLVLASALPENLLPPEVLLVEPTPQEIKKGSTRSIFLNTPLDDEELNKLVELEKEISRQGRAMPNGMRIHALRCLQHAKGNVPKAIERLDQSYSFRLKWLPLHEKDVVDDLRKGAMYWHGRDHRCRPCLVIRACRLGHDFVADPDRIIRVAVWLLEFMLRYGLCPGRVENWGVIVDLDKAGQDGYPSVTLINNLVQTLQGNYRFRMAWTKILHAPFWFTPLWSAIKSVVPGESVQKVEMLSKNFGQTLLKLMAPHQLEERYGGTAKNLEGPNDFFPMRSIPGPFAVDSKRAQSPPVNMKLHELVSHEFHEGVLLDRSRQSEWEKSVSAASLTSSTATYLRSQCSLQVRPCRNIVDINELLQVKSSAIYDDGIVRIRSSMTIQSMAKMNEEEENPELQDIPVWIRADLGYNSAQTKCCSATHGTEDETTTGTPNSTPGGTPHSAPAPPAAILELMAPPEPDALALPAAAEKEQDRDQKANISFDSPTVKSGQGPFGWCSCERVRPCA